MEQGTVTVEATDEDAPPVARRSDGRAGGSAPDQPDPRPFIPLPKRTTHGGDWGPKMRAKFEAEALAKGHLW